VGSNCRFFQWSGDGATSTGTASTLGALQSAFSASPWGYADTHVYQDMYTGLPDNCPFPTIAGLAHYGDWIDLSPPMFSYYEKYSDGTYGYYVKKVDGTVLLDTLSDSKGALIDDGYMLLTRTPLSGTDLNITGGSGSGTADDSLGSTVISYGGTDLLYYRYFLPTGIINTNTASSSFYMTAIIGGTTYYYNPHFAKAAFNNATSLPSFGGTAYIRSSRQFNNLANSSHSAYWAATYSIQQQLDLDFTTYSFSISSLIGTSTSAPFRGTYDGGGYTMTIDSNAKDAKNALFGYNYGKIINLNVTTSGTFSMTNAVLVSTNSTTGSIENCSVTVGANFSTGVSNSNGAVLVSTNAGTIQNCSVVFSANFSILSRYFGPIAYSNTGTISGCLVTSSNSVTLTGASNTNLGGLVYTNSGTITYSYVRPGIDTYASLTLKGYMTAGFVYTCTGGSITYCSSTATVTVLSKSTSGRNGAGFVYTVSGSGKLENCYANCVVTAYTACGFAYSISGTNGYIRYCYSMLDVNANTSGGTGVGFIYTGGSTVTHCYAATQVSGKTTKSFSSNNSNGTNCRYLNWTGCGSATGSTATASSRAQLVSAYSGSPWGNANSYPYWDIYSVTAPCLYPLIAGLDHYGDWPNV
jgi:hypothetical protein